MAFSNSSQNNSEPINLESMSHDDRAFFEQCRLEIAKFSSTVSSNLTTTSTTLFSSEVDNITSETLTDGESSDNACLTLLDFKRNPHRVLTQNTIYIIIAVYSLLMVAGLITNLSVCWVVVRHSQARTARNLMIINLAMSDMTVCFVSMPFTMLRLINHTSWDYGDGLCRLTSLLEGVNLLVSSGTASAIAGDRLCMVRRKTARQDDTKAKTVGYILMIIWSVSFVAILPTAFFTGTYDVYFPDTTLVMSHVCTEIWPFVSLHLVYSVVLMVVQYIIPITVILFTHTKIIGIVRQRTTRTTTMTGSARAEVTMKRNKKTTQILLIIAAAFGVHWLPFHIYTIGFEVARKTSMGLNVEPDVELILFFVVHSFAMLSTITNPILYGWLNTNLKHLFRAMIPHVRNESRAGLGGGHGGGVGGGNRNGCPVTEMSATIEIDADDDQQRFSSPEEEVLTNEDEIPMAEFQHLGHL